MRLINKKRSGLWKNRAQEEPGSMDRRPDRSQQEGGNIQAATDTQISNADTQS